MQFSKQLLTIAIFLSHRAALIAYNVETRNFSNLKSVLLQLCGIETVSVQQQQNMLLQFLLNPTLHKTHQCLYGELIITVLSTMALMLQPCFIVNDTLF